MGLQTDKLKGTTERRCAFKCTFKEPEWDYNMERQRKFRNLTQIISTSFSLNRRV